MDCNSIISFDRFLANNIPMMELYFDLKWCHISIKRKRQKLRWNENTKEFKGILLSIILKNWKFEQIKFSDFEIFLSKILTKFVHKVLTNK